MTAEQLGREFAARGLERGGSVLLGAADALALVRRARAARLPVLAIDGFHLAGEDARPDHVHSIDFVGASCRTNPWAEAEAFLEEREGSPLHFGVSLGEPPSPGGESARGNGNGL